VNQQNPDKEKEKEDKSLHQDKEKKKEDEKENTKKSKMKKTLEIPLLSDLNGDDDDDDEDELYDDGELVDENDDNFELKPPKSNSRKCLNFKGPSFRLRSTPKNIHEFRTRCSTNIAITYSTTQGERIYYGTVLKFFFIQFPKTELRVALVSCYVRLESTKNGPPQSESKQCI